MKKNSIVILLLMLMFFLTSCFTNTYKTHEEKIELTINDEYREYMTYDQIPSFTLTFDGKLNTSDRLDNKYEIVFLFNDDFKLSDIISNLINKYQKSISYRPANEEKLYNDAKLTKMNTLDYDSLDPKQQTVELNVDGYKTYDEIAFITLENGLQLTFEYRRFSSTENNITKTYYAWRYSNNIRMILQYPLMVINNNKNEKEILILALPNGINYQLGQRIGIDKLTKDDTYLDKSYYTFRYLNYNDEFNAQGFVLEDEIKYVKDYYITNWNGQTINNIFYFEYLGKKFSITFGDYMFTIDYIKE